MTSALLTADEIETLTHPLKQGAARCRYLEREYGVKVKRAPNGQPVVARVEFEAAMMTRRLKHGAGAAAGAEPDWQAVRSYGKRPKLHAVN